MTAWFDWMVVEGSPFHPEHVFLAASCCVRPRLRVYSKAEAGHVRASSLASGWIMLG